MCATAESDFNLLRLVRCLLLFVMLSCSLLLILYCALRVRLFANCLHCCLLIVLRCALFVCALLCCVLAAATLVATVVAAVGSDLCNLATATAVGIFCSCNRRCINHNFKRSSQN